MSVVVDASAMVEFLLGNADAAALGLHSGDPVAPDLIHPEVGNALARLYRRGLLDRSGLEALVQTFLDLELDVVPTRELVRDALSYVDRISIYDGCYVALAVAEDATLVTSDRRLARAHGLPVDVVVV